MSPGTRKVRGNTLQAIEKTVGDTDLSKWKRGDIVAGRDKRAGHPAAALHFVNSLRAFFKWAVDAGVAKNDPTEGIKVAKPKGNGFPVWTDTDIMAFRAQWPLGTRERLAFEILLGTGLRRGDAARVGRPHLRDGVVRMTTEKTGERIAVAVSRALAEAIAAGPCGELTFIATESGRPFVKDAFGNWFGKACRAAGVRKSAHGLRKAAATADAMDGYTEIELNAKYGWTGRDMAGHYTRSANRERLSLGAAERTKK